MFSFDRAKQKKAEKQHEKIELLIYRIYCWKRKTRAFREIAEEKKAANNPKKEFISIR
jgi:hypothetical protein